VSATDLLGMVAELKESLRVQASWLERLNARLVELENERKQIIDALPFCPTCATWTDTENCCLPGQPCRICGVDADGNPCDSPICPDCTDGRMDVFRALARLAELEADNKEPT